MTSRPGTVVAEARHEAVSYRSSRRVGLVAGKSLVACGKGSGIGNESLSLSVSAILLPAREAVGWRFGSGVVRGEGAAVRRASGWLSRRGMWGARCDSGQHHYFGNERKTWGCGVGELTPSRSYVSARGLIAIRDRLSERDLAVTKQVAELRLMSARQIQAVHFPASAHGSMAAATRARQRVLERLTRERLLSRLERRIGGVRAGSAGLVLALGPIGQRLLAPSGRRRRLYEPTLRFVDHTLAVAQLVVDVTLAARRGVLDVLDLQAEPSCWREFSGLGGRRWLRPDAFLALGSGDYELRWFIEMDRASESLPVVVRKCHLYVDYYQSGKEQAAGGVFPRVCWIAPGERRATALRDAIERDRSLPAPLFVVTTTAQAVTRLSSTEKIN